MNRNFNAVFSSIDITREIYWIFCLQSKIGAYYHRRTKVSLSILINEIIRRPVKDVHFGMDCFESLTQSSSMTNLQLLIIGPAIDRKYAETIFARINNSRNIYHLPLLKQDELFERVSRALCTINCSTSEGQSAAILESMALGIPVIARNIGGNQFIKSMGTLYNCPETFCKSVKENCSDVESWQRASENARSFVKEHHSSAAERDFYINTVNGALQNKLKFQLLNNNRD